MATFKKVQTKSGVSWRVQLSVLGHREAKSLSTKAEAVAWATERETEIRKMVQTGVVTGKTCQDAFDRYVREVSATKRGKRWEDVRLRAIAAFDIDGKAIGAMMLSDVTPDLLGRWRDARMRGTPPEFKDKVKGATVIRDLNLLSHVFSTARKEWKWIDASPTGDVRRPKDSDPRDRRIQQDEIDRLCHALNFDGRVKTKSQAVAAAFLFAVETAMRAGEICKLERGWVVGSVAHLPASANKNGIKRDVPLSARAREILKLMPVDQSPYFGITPASLDALFSKAKAAAMIEDMTFHDSRHDAGHVGEAGYRPVV